jgi:hypothetical protein
MLLTIKLKYIKMEKLKDLNYWKNNAEEDYITTPISVLRYITELEKEVESKELNLPLVMDWVAVKDALPNNDYQVFVKYKNGKYGINEWWESDNCWKYQFDNMIVEKWMKPHCA